MTTATGADSDATPSDGAAEAVIIAADGAAIVPTVAHRLATRPGRRVVVIGAVDGPGADRVAIRPCDLTDDAAVARSVAAVADECGGSVHALVTLTSRSARGPSALLGTDAVEGTMRANAIAAFLACRAVYPHMRRGGVIVNVVSVAAHRAFPGRLAFSMAKAAVLGLTRCLAAEWAAEGIRVNALTAPDLGSLDLRGNPISDGEHAVRGALLAGPPSDEDIAGSIDFLVSAAPRFMTGAELVVDAGWLSRGESRCPFSPRIMSGDVQPGD